ncbi:sugar phosphate isomerase/epimerase [Chitinophaga polysaccharea]|uniref:Sugar phosphate isomerase/epimerase n=1 Tax=Chitinophaga polysaccharea TaxID=1293035 RepID=A0A561PPE3_9BACT|nr:sugar phosphate isomerase/epimerase [Chitinophaga polysaccharea]TWF39981.1 sugar phosphate isomerase/epimerase [Chitinophaga polysaccharea]
MAIQFFCPRWGSESLSWEAFIKKVKEEGYDGIECGIAFNTPEQALEQVWNLAAKAGLEIIAQHYDTNDADFSQHYDNYCKWLEKMAGYPVVKINSQTGKDYFSFHQNKQLIDAANACGRLVIHETHRNKFSFAAHIMSTYLQQIPALRITLDASHWVCVAESYLEDQVAAMQLAIERTDHIHARVGYTEGPQVSDPRMAQWEYAVSRHLSWWDDIVARLQREEKTVTITTEFGPYPYMVYEPSTGKPVVDQWQVNVYMMNLLRDRYS